MARMGLVTVEFLKKNRKYAILIIFIVAALVTPGPDVISQLMMALPLMVLYEMSILGARVFGKKKDIILIGIYTLDLQSKIQFWGYNMLGDFAGATPIWW